ncbi:putative metal homeostasis protein [Fructilactobacillus lindneri]|nr:putative metal homeostasis protein [Fructilactobacillus lindneri]
MKKEDLATAYRNLKSPNKRTKSRALRTIKKAKNEK